jgi:uncharacterized protein YcbK (DUF882 family)
MHRVAAPLLAFLGALTLPHRDGRADPSVGAPSATAEEPKTSKHAASEIPAKQAGNLAPAENDETGKKPAGPPTKPRKSADNEPPSKKSPPSNIVKKSEAPASGPPKGASEKSPAKGKTAPAWTKGQPGVVKLVRGSETLEVRVLDRRQHVVPATLPQFAQFLRAKSGADHAIDVRLVTLVATVSDHFGGREVNVVSGFRPYSPGQYARHSNHNEGRAIDFSIKGIANETVRDFCRSLHNVGVGYYPNSLFVHLDVRDKNTYWVDYAAPGQAPRYQPADSKSGDDDEGDGVASVDDGGPTTTSSSDTTRSDVTRGRHSGRGGDIDSTGGRGVFVNR